MWISGWGRRDFQGRANSGDEGSEMGVHVKSLVKSKGACEAGAMIKVRQAVESLSGRALEPWEQHWPLF